MTVLPLPSSLSPSRLTEFRNCPLSFQFSAINRIRADYRTDNAVAGTLTHAALEGFYRRPGPERTEQALLEELALALKRCPDEEFGGDVARVEEFVATEWPAKTADMAMRVFDIEDPARTEVLELEVKIHADLQGVPIRGVIDRVVRLPNGTVWIDDWKTGRVPRINTEHSRMANMHVYAALYEAETGVRPEGVRLIFLSTDPPTVISAAYSDPPRRAVAKTIPAIWSSVETNCRRGAFMHRTGKLCEWCDYQQWCPAFGGDPADAPMNRDIAPTGEPD